MRAFVLVRFVRTRAIVSERVGLSVEARDKHGSESPWSGFLKISASLSLSLSLDGGDARNMGQTRVDLAGARSRRRVATGRTYNSRRDVCTPTRRRVLHSGHMTHTVQRLRAIPFLYP
jgi:hypothetical protein